MASALTDKLSRLVKHISGQARITESNVADMLREVRMALLEADVALPVVRDFIARVKEKALGQEVIGSLQPGQALVAIVNQELAATMGEGVSDLNLAAQPPAVRRAGAKNGACSLADGVRVQGINLLWCAPTGPRGPRRPSAAHGPRPG